MDNEHNAIKKAVLGDELGYYERENSVIKHIQGYLKKSKDFANNIFDDIRKKKDEFIANLQSTIKTLKSKITNLENENTDLKYEISNFQQFYKDTYGDDLDMKMTKWAFDNNKNLFKKNQSVESTLTTETEISKPKTRTIRTIYGTKTIKDDGLSL